jgi:PAS domain S-box-containing protein
MTITPAPDFQHLRQRAEALLDANQDAPCILTPLEIKTLVHDLSVHQIELELQNDELLHAQQQIEKNRDELARLYHQAPVGYLTLNRTGAIERCNQTFATMVGRSTDMLINKPLADLLEGSDRDIFLGRFRSFYNQPADKFVDLYFPTRGITNGFHGRLTASIGDDSVNHADREPRLLVIVQDVTEQRIESLIRMKAESKLKSHDAFISTLLETMPIPIFYKDVKCRYLGCNQAFRDFTGLDNAQLLGKTVFDISPADIAIGYDDFDQQLLANPGTQSYEWKVSAPDGSIRTVVFNKATYADADGQLAGIVGAIQDISDLKGLQSCMQQARESAEEASRIKSEFLANMSHELRTPMNGVLGMAQLLEMSSLDTEQQQFVAAIMQSGMNLVKIIGDILDLSKIEAQRIELEHLVFSLNEIINQTINLLRPQAQAKGLKIFCRLDPNLPELFWGDPGRLHQILLNLLGNSIKFTSSGSISITVLSGPDEAGKTSLRFSINDTGIGIPRASLHKLFIPFSQVDGSTTRRFGGTGLGLAISKQLVELMGGSISVESTEGTGSTFFIKLPLEQATGPDCEPFIAAELQEQIDHTPQNYRILVAEDDKLNRKVIEIMLGKLGYRTGIAASGEETLALLKAEEFDLVLMDCSMPGIDGYEATAKIRDIATGVKNPQISIVALTARVMQGDREKCLKAGMNDYLPKPIHCDELKNVLSRWLPSKPS